MPGVSVAHEPGASGHSGLHAPRTVTTPSGQAPGQGVDLVGVVDVHAIQVAAVQHVASTNYALVQQHLFNPELSRTVLSVFMSDTLKRAPAVNENWSVNFQVPSR